MGRDPKAEIEISAHSRGLASRLREARAKFGVFGAELKKNVFGKDLVEKGFWSKAGATMVGGLLGSATSSLAGLFFDQAKGAARFQDQLVRLQIAARKTPEQMQDFGDSVRAASNETGIGADQIMAAAKAYVALTGDMDGAAASSRQWARIAQATDSTVADIAGTAAALKQQMNIDPSQMEAAFSALAIQGKEGAIELKDLASQLSTIAPQWAQFGGASGKGVQGVKELGAALQVVKRGFGGDASETVTGLQSLLNALIKNAARFKHAGVNIFEKDGKTLRNVLDIVRDIGDSKLAKNPTKLEKAMGRVEAYRAFLQLQQNRDVLDDLISKADDAGVIARDFATYMQSPAGKMASAGEQMKNAIQAAFTPERIELFASVMEKVAGGIEKVSNALGAVWDRVTGKGEVKNPYSPAVEAISAQDALEVGVTSDMYGKDKALAAASALNEKANVHRRMLEAQANLPGAYGQLARDRLAAENSFGDKWGDISSRRTSLDRRREAVQATLAAGDGGTREGIRRAGQMYLERENVSQAEIDRLKAEIRDQNFAAKGDQLGPLVKELGRLVVALAEGDKRPISVKADGSKIADVQRGARSNARRPGG